MSFFYISIDLSLFLFLSTLQEITIFFIKIQKTPILVFLPCCPIQPKWHFGQFNFDIIFFINVFLTKQSWDILTHQSDQLST
jgi:hypothetical protein